jgi:hypothetical protein
MPYTHHRQIQQTSGIDRHGWEQWANHVPYYGDARAVGAEHVVAVDLVRDDGRLGHVHVHVLEHVRAVGQVQQHGLVAVLRQPIRLENKIKFINI